MSVLAPPEGENEDDYIDFGFLCRTSLDACSPTGVEMGVVDGVLTKPEKNH
jgi:hypothetical protein